MAYETLVFEQQDGIARVRLNRPDAANALNLQMGKELMDVALRLDSDAGVRAVVLTGTGKVFSAGGDLAAFAKFGDEIGQKLKVLTGLLHLAQSRLMRMRAPVIVAVNGVAAGAGMSMVCSGDIVLVSDKARFTMAYTRAGLTPDGGATYTLPRLIGMRRTQELMITNRMLSAQEAVDWGIGTRVVEHDKLEAEATALAEQIAAGPTSAFSDVKRLLLSSNNESLEAQMELEARSISAAAGGAEGKEGVAAFLEKRAPSFNP